MRKIQKVALAVLPIAALVMSACSSGTPSGNSTAASDTGSATAPAGDTGSATAPAGDTGSESTESSPTGESGSSAFSATPSGTLKAWAFANADDVGKARMEAAAAAIPGVDIQMDATSFDAQKFTTRLASGNVPDIVQINSRYVAQYAAQKLIMPLDECYSAHQVDPRTYFYPQVADDVTYDSHVWAVPSFYQPPAIILNERVMKAAGVTDDEIDPSQPDVLLGAIAKMYKESGGNPTTLGFDPVASGQAGLWILSQGGQLTDANGVPTLDDPSNIAGVELLKKINDAQGGFAKVKSFSDTFDTFGDNNQFVADQVGAQVDAQWYPNVLVSTADKIQIAAVPFKDKDGNPFAVTSGNAYVIPAAAANPAAACAWALGTVSNDAWMKAADARVATLTGKGQQIFTGLMTGSPGPDQAIREAYVKPTGTQFDEVIATYYDVLTHGKSYGASPAGLTIDSELNNAITSAMLGEKSPQDALKDAQDNAKKAYDDIMAG